MSPLRTIAERLCYREVDIIVAADADRRTGMTSELLQQVRTIDPASNTDCIADVWIEDGSVRAIETTIDRNELSAETAVRDCQGSILGTGLIDLYSHSGEPGEESVETLASLQAAAVAGGFTRVAILPDTQPRLDRPEVIHSLRNRAIDPHVELLPWGALTLGTQGERLTEMAELVAAQIVGFSDGQPIEDLLLLRRQLEYAQSLDRPIAIWPYSTRLTNGGTAREGSDSLRFGLAGDPAMAEAAMLAAAIECVAELGVAAHFMRVSTARGVELIDRAKQRGLNITASTPWTHLLLSTRDLSRYDPNFRFFPPIGTPADRDTLAAAVQSGTIDAIAIDHRAIAYEDKTVAFSEAPAGAIGLEIALPLLWQEFVKSGQWSPLDLWRALSFAPATCLGCEPPILQAGAAAELVLFEPDRAWMVSSENLKSLSSNTPWIDRQIAGRVARIYR